MLFKICDYEFFQPHVGGRISVFRFGECLGSFSCDGAMDEQTALAALACIRGLGKGL